MISVENVVAENFPSLQRKSPTLKRPLLACLRYLCHEREFQWFEEKYPNLSGFDFVDQVGVIAVFQVLVSEDDAFPADAIEVPGLVAGRDVIKT